MRRYLLNHVLLNNGWARDVVFTLGEAGEILAAEPGSPRDADETVAGFVVPGMPNAHSHAFQRAMAGATEYRASGNDSFWTWRQAMYALANRIAPDELQAIAQQLFIEMLKRGYTSVAEFHYLHQQLDGSPYPNASVWYEAIEAAAEAAGIGLTLLPTLYQHSDFGRAPLRAEQARFGLATAEFIGRVAARNVHRRPFARIRTGAAFHSLRAVDVATLPAAHRDLMQVDATMPIHIHVSEQLREVQSCRRHTGLRPIELLLGTGLVDEHWCLVHATHADAGELQGVLRSGATICICPSTEANLGDGLFNAQNYLGQSGNLCIGSDSEITVDPAEELRWFEYQHRLRRKRRAVLASAAQNHVGTRLWRTCAAGGARALGQRIGELEPGRRADWLVLDHTHPALSGSSPDGALDRLVFGSAREAIRDVMVAGEWVIRGGAHARQELAAAAYRKAIARLTG
jgi:formimidoylglutamate deiminase